MDSDSDKNMKYFIRFRPEIWTRNFSIRNSCGNNFNVTLVIWEDDNEQWVGGGGGANLKKAAEIFKKKTRNFFVKLFLYMVKKIMKMWRGGGGGVNFKEADVII